MELERSFGVLLHPTSIPGPWGIGTLGEQARRFVDWLQEAGAGWWQVLPLGPTGYGDSPYQAVSSFAGNPYLIDPEPLFERGFLAEREELPFPKGWVDFGWIYNHKWQQLRRAFAGFTDKATPAERERLAAFRKAEAFWVDNYALYKALKAAHQQQAWDRWPEELKGRDPASLAEARTTFAEDVDFHVFTQWLFFDQWTRLRAYAAERSVRIIGDIPIFVAHDSPEVWGHPGMFHIDDAGRPVVKAGVPPDYFSETGQLWGNPLYRWEAHRADGYAWWCERLRTVLKTCDLVRIDHFRGFQAYWEVPGEAETAIRGRWVEGPGEALFEAISSTLGDTPIIAEDLGVITPEVEQLRDSLGFPGMKVLQFAFDGDADNAFLPDQHPAHGNYIVYPGTHDNETTLGWYRNLPIKLRRQVQDYLLSYELPTSPEEAVPWSFTRLAMKSPAKLTVVTLQDLLCLGNKARMNTPSVATGNWSWRYRSGDLTPALAERLRAAAQAADRLA